MIERAKIATVLMPVHNAAEYLKESIDCILNQSFKEFDFLIINDGSSDASEEIIKSYTDNRIIYVRNEKNIRLVATLNRGVELIKTKYLIRMDADDICPPDRLQKQIEFMEKNADLGLSGTQISLFGKASETWNYPLEDKKIRTLLLFRSPLAHASIIIKRELFDKVKYSEEVIHMEDYMLWNSLSKFAKFGNLNEDLYRYRITNTNITKQNWDSRQERFKGVYRRVFNDLKLEVSPENIAAHVELNTKPFTTKEHLKRYREWLNFLKNEPIISNLSDKPYLNELLIQSRDRVFYACVKSGTIATWNYFVIFRNLGIKKLRYFLSFKLKRK